MAFAVLLILVGVVGLVLDARGELAGPAFGWAPGAAVTCLIIGSLLMLAALGRRGAPPGRRPPPPATARAVSGAGCRR